MTYTDKNEVVPILEIMSHPAFVVFHDFLYMANYDPECLHMYLHPEKDDDAENEDKENDDEDGHDDMVKDDGPLKLVPHDCRAMTDVRSRMTDEMYTTYRREP